MTASISGPQYRAGPLRLPPALTAVGQARFWAADVCRQWHADSLREDVILVLSELVSNAVRHAGTHLAVELAGSGSGIRIEVTDESSRPLRQRTVTGPDEAGNGLVLVDALAARWGVTGGPAGKRVWAELQAPDHGR